MCHPLPVPVAKQWSVLAVSCALTFLQLSQAQGPLGAVEWLPTQGENDLLAQLTNHNVDDLSSADVALSTRGILGIIPFQQVADSHIYT